MKLKQDRKLILMTVAGGLIAGGLIMSLVKSNRGPIPADETAAIDEAMDASANSPAGTPAAATPAPSNGSAATPAVPPVAGAPVTAQEVASLNQMTTLLSKMRGVRGPSQLAEVLQNEGHEPFIARDRNPDTGEMTIVRTKSPLPGTRYLHAQFFKQEDGSQVLQHVSFEFKAGPTSRKEALDAVQRSFAGLGQPTVNDASFVKWNLPNGYLVSVSMPTTQQLLDDPFNAHTADDAGTVVVTYEQEIHE